MYKVAASWFALLGLFAFSEASGGLQGFPSQYLPSSDLSAGIFKNSTDGSWDVQVPLNGSSAVIDSIRNLLLPLDPRQARSLEQRFYYTPAVSPQGSHLFVTLVGATYMLWRDIANLPLQSARAARFPPFQDFEHRYLPSGVLHAQLTPWKLGVVYCWAIRGSITQEVWPGNITAHIYDFDRAHGTLQTYLGRLVVLNNPPNGAVDSKSPSQGNVNLPDTTSNNPSISTGASTQYASHVGNAIFQQSSAILEKAYLESISKIVFLAFKHYSYGKIRNAYWPGTTLRFSTRFDANIESRLHIFEDPQGQDLTWDQVLQIVLQLSTDVANHRDWPEPRWAQIQWAAGEAAWAQVWVGPKTAPSPGGGADGGVAVS